MAESRETILKALQTAKLTCFDGNLPASDISILTKLCKSTNVPCWFEPTTTQKATRIIQADALKDTKYLSPNEVELHALSHALSGSGHESLSRAAENVLRLGGGGRHGQTLLVTRGAKGVTRFRLEGADGDGDGLRLVETAIDAAHVAEVGNTTGAGDAFAGACIAGLARGVAEVEAVRMGIEAAAECCRAGGGATVRATVRAKL